MEGALGGGDPDGSIDPPGFPLGYTTIPGVPSSQTDFVDFVEGMMTVKEEAERDRQLQAREDGTAGERDGGRR